MRLVFTISARNTLPQVRVLHAALARHCPDVRFTWALCDLPTGLDLSALPFPVLDLLALHDPRVWGMAGRYGVSELCTAIKPAALLRLLARHPGAQVLYLDPDIQPLSPLPELWDALDAGAEAVLTPHLLKPGHDPDILPGRGLLTWGAYNLGFLGVRDTPAVRSLLAWWADRLEHGCVDDPARGLFLDQKWADLFPSLVAAHVLRHPGYNVAWWNASERPVRHTPAGWTADGAPLRFVHHSGHDVSRPDVFSRHAAHLPSVQGGALPLLQGAWREAVLAAGQAGWSQVPFAFRWHGAGGRNTHALQPPAPAQETPCAVDKLAVRSWDEWQAAKAWRAADPARRAAEQALLPPGREDFTCAGTCTVCEAPSVFGSGWAYAPDPAPGEPDAPNWREHLTCRCGFSNRQRAALHALRHDVRLPPDADVYVTEADTFLHAWLKLRWPGTVGSEYFGPGHAPGALVDGTRHEDLCSLSFPDASFDAVLSFEVLEHVADLGQALRECARVLRPGGVLLFTAPVRLDAPETLDRARIRPDGTVEQLLPPEMHGHPVLAEGSLCMRHVGLEILDQLRRTGFAAACCLFYWSDQGKFLGGNQNMIVAVKSGGLFAAAAAFQA